MTGFGNEFATEHPDYPKALPEGQNSPQKCAYGLYAEQLSGTAFTAPRVENQRTWFYRIKPAVCHQPFQRYDEAKYLIRNWNEQHPNPNQFRWNPFDLPTEKVDFVGRFVNFKVI
jgi:homogentisate 1,2-dioxygenase